MVARVVRAMQFYHLSRKGAMLLIGIVLAKIGLSMDEIGLFETLMFLAMLLSFFWVESIIKGFLSLFEEYNTEQKAQSYFSLYLLFLGLAALFGIVLWLGQETLIPVFVGEDSIAHLGLLVVYLVVFQPSTITVFIYQLNGQVKEIILYSLLQSIGLLVAVVVPLLLDLGIGGVFRGMIIFASCLHIVTLITVLRSGRLKLDPGLVNRLLMVSVPLVAYAVIQSFAGVFDAWLVNHHFGSRADFAVFRFGARELPIVIPLTIGVVNLALPLLTRNLNEGLALLKAESRKLMHVIFPLAIFLIMTSRWFFVQIYNQDFEYSAWIFNVYLLLVIPQLLFPQSIFMSKKDNRLLVVVGALEVLINVLLSLWWVGQWGMLGIAMATVVAFVFEKIALIVVCGLRHQVDSNSYVPWTTFLIYSGATMAIFFLTYYNEFGL